MMIYLKSYIYTISNIKEPKFLLFFFHLAYSIEAQPLTHSLMSARVSVAVAQAHSNPIALLPIQKKSSVSLIRWCRRSCHSVRSAAVSSVPCLRLASSSTAALPSSK